MAVQIEQVDNAQSHILQKSNTAGALSLAFPPMDYKRFKWSLSANDPKLHSREVVGCELYEELWARFNHGEFTIFFGVNVKNSKLGVSNDRLVQKARAAWGRLRFSIPTLASHVAYDSKGRVLLTYRSVDSAQEVDEWVSRTFQVKDEVSNLNDLRYTLGQTITPDAEDLVFLHFVPLGDAFGLLLQTQHVLFDGAGAKILMTKYLKMMVDCLAREVDDVLEWGTEAKNLEPAVPFVLADDQVLEGPVYQETLGEILSSLATNQPRAYGLRDAKCGVGTSCRVQHKFSKEESSALLRASKAKGFTINQIAHSALSMVAAEDSPVTDSTLPDASLLYFNLVNARDRLAQPYKSNLGYTSNCLAMHPVTIPMSVFSKVTNFEDSTVVSNIATLIKSQYERARSSPALIGVIAQQIELMLSPLVNAAAHAERAGQKFTLPPTLGPWYSGDGIVETYLPRQVTNKSGDSVFEIEEVFTSLNIVDPRPFFRMYTFRDEIILSVDHNEKAIVSERVDSLLRRWSEFMRLIL